MKKVNNLIYLVKMSKYLYNGKFIWFIISFWEN